MSKKYFWLVLFTAFLVVMPLVEAGPLFDFIEELFTTSNPLDFYDKFSGWIDFLIYMIIFIGLIFGVLKERFNTSTKWIGVAMGTALSFSLIQFYPQMITNLGPIAFLIFVAIFFYLIFISLKDNFQSKWLPMAIAYIISFLILFVLDPEKKLERLFARVELLDSTWQILKDILTIGLGIAIAILIVSLLYFLFKWIFNRGSSGGSSSKGGSSSGPSGGGGGRSSSGNPLKGGKGDRKWWGRKKPSHPKRTLKRLRGAIASDELKAEETKEAIDLVKDYKRVKDKLSDEEKQTIMRKISSLLQTKLTKPLSEEIMNSLRSVFVEITRYRDFLDFDKFRADRLHVQDFLNWASFTSNNDKAPLMQLIQEMGEKNEQLTTYANQIGVFGRIYESNQARYRTIISQVLQEVHSGNLDNLSESLSKLLDIEKSILETDRDATNALEDGNFAILLNEIKDIYSPLEQISDPSKRANNINNMWINIKIIHLKNLFKRLIETYLPEERDRTFENFMGKLTAAYVEPQRILNEFRLRSTLDIRRFFEIAMTEMTSGHNADNSYGGPQGSYYSNPDDSQQESDHQGDYQQEPQYPGREPVEADYTVSSEEEPEGKSHWWDNIFGKKEETPPGNEDSESEDDTPKGWAFRTFGKK